MLTLYLVRHARAMAIAASDKERELTKEGCVNATKLGALFTDKFAQPDHVICSSALRTQQTFQLMRDAGLAARSDEVLDGLYDASPAFLLETIRTQEAQSLLVIGHNPALAILLNRLVAEDDIAPNLMHFPTATLAKISFDETSFDALSETHNGHLKSLVRGSEL